MSVIQYQVDIKNFKRRLRKKADELLQEAEDTCSTIQQISFKVQEETENLLAQDDENFFHKYKKFQEYLGNLSEKFFLSQSILQEVFKEGNSVLSKEEPRESSIHSDTPVLPGATSNHLNASQLQANQGFNKIPKDAHLTKPKPNFPGASESENSYVVSEDILLPSLCTSINASISNVSTDFRISDKSAETFDSDSLQDAKTLEQRMATISQPPPPPVDTTLPMSDDRGSEIYEDILNTSHLTGVSATSTSSFLSTFSSMGISPLGSVSIIPPATISVGSTIAVLIANVVNPSDFWLRLRKCPVIEKNASSCDLQPIDASYIKDIKFCLAYWKLTRKYRRAEILSLFQSGKEMSVQVLFIDYGDKDILQVSDLKLLPSSMILPSSQAIHCYLQGVDPIGSSWSVGALMRFFEITTESDLFATIISKEDKKFAVKLSYGLNVTEGEMEVDIGEILILDGFAHLKQETSQRFESETKPKLVDLPCAKEDDFHDSKPQELPYLPKPMALSKEIINPLDNSQPKKVSRQYSDPYHESPLQNDVTSENSDIYLSDEFDNELLSCLEEIQSENKPSSAQPNIREFSVNKPEQETEAISYSPPEDSTIPPAAPLFVKDDLMIIIPSVIYSPTYFYANIGTVNSLELDELREQMTIVYNRLESSGHSQHVENIENKMFFACRFTDNNWYRVQINDFWDSEDNSTKVVVLYIDYGNESMVTLKELRPLLEIFSKIPAMAVLCSLAYIKPKSYDKDCKDVDLFKKFKWDKEATDRFHELTKNEKLLTAQVAGFQRLDEDRTLYQVFLWDEDEAGTCKIINDVLVEEGYADYINLNILPSLLTWKSHAASTDKVVEEKRMITWDPMKQDFDSVMNSYGVDSCDAEIATVGYKAQDENYICKYYSSNRVCFKGDRCPYQHIAVSHDETTMDQESVYSFEKKITLPNVGTYCLVQISCLLTAGHFYVVFPYGIVNLEDYKTGWCAKANTEIVLLNEAMNEYYSNAPFEENTAIAPALGTIVAAKCHFDGTWYRARITEVQDITKPVKVFYVDFGMEEYVKRQNIRVMLPQFLHCPFQAVEAFLANVGPINKKEGGRWSEEAKLVLQRLVQGNVLLGFVNANISSVLFLTLTMTKEQNRSNVNNFLVQEGFAQYSSLQSVNHFTNFKHQTQTDQEANIIEPG